MTYEYDAALNVVLGHNGFHYVKMRNGRELAEVAVTGVEGHHNDRTVVGHIFTHTGAVSPLGKRYKALKVVKLRLDVVDIAEIRSI